MDDTAARLSATLDALATGIPDAVRDLVKAFWPGGLTIILRATPSLAWDLGETGGTVALRMPDDEIALALDRAAGNRAAAARALGVSVRTLQRYLTGRG